MIVNILFATNTIIVGEAELTGSIVDESEFYIGQPNSTTSCTKSNGKVEIPDTVKIDGKQYKITHIYPYAFSNARISHLKTSTSLSEIGEYSFVNCTSLSVADLSESKLTSLPIYAFYGCSSLANLKLPPTIDTFGDYCFAHTNIILFNGNIRFKSVGKYTFSYMKQLKSIDFSQSAIDSLPEGIFKHTDQLKFVFLPKTITRIENFAFSHSGILSIEFPENISYIGELAFYSASNINNINLSNLTIKEIYKQTFSKCTELRQLSLPSTLVSIHEEAFSETSIVNLILPESVSTIGIRSFYSCPNLLTVDLSHSKIESIHDETFKSCEKLTNVSFTENLKEINNSAFAKTSVISIVLPSTVTNINDGVFFGCQSLLSADISQTKISILPKHFFRKCIKLSTISLPKTITKLDDFCFAFCQSLSDLNLQDIPITSVEESAFLQCLNLKLILFGKTLEIISSSCFMGCEQLQQVNLYSTKLSTIGSLAFSKCSSLSDIKLPETVNFINDSAFELTSLTEINLPKNVQKMGIGVFQNCAKLTSVDMSSCVSLLHIDNYSFSSNALLTNIKLPPNLKSIGVGTFSDCSFTSIEFPNSLEIIHSRAFSSTKISSLDLYKTNLHSLGNGTFMKCPSLSKVSLPNKLTVINESCFSNCQRLVEINISNTNVDTINDNLFSGCSNLEIILLPETLKTIKVSPFKDTSIEKLRIPPLVNKIHVEAFKGASKLDVLSYCGKYKFDEQLLFDNKVKIYVINNYPHNSFGGAEIVGFDKCPVLVPNVSRQFRSKPVSISLLCGFIVIAIVILGIMKLVSPQPKMPKDEEELLSESAANL
ncbi:regulation of response to stimulus [Trichomonas vaginalis G3]|uniref:regulation of response to stimulus n=1 Tax=Trichomonas vaginalis (strain ATCC PRA-98 / G3) TaxID=412133 RepID=UPI0021E5789F|nr:regulation of response to stimulus [Trichomonas vaginalis G3]KAI5548472.1 regulation of response to stimulus [Trichomonas vaginalis G3]